jgi:hypothetical protein
MKKTFLLKNLPLLILASGLVLTVAFAQTTNSKQKATTTDTIPSHPKKIRDLDEALAEIDKGELEMQKALKEWDHDKMESEVRKAMKDMEQNMAKMKEELARSMKEVDMQKIELDMQKAMKEIDSEKMKKEISESLAKVDMQKVKAELEKAKVEMEKVKEIDMKKMKEELANIQPQIEKAMKEAKEDIAKARKEINNYKNLVSALDRDGLLDKKGHYKIEYRNKELTVNGKKLSAEATAKYSEFLGEKDNFTLQKDADGLDIKNDK